MLRRPINMLVREDNEAAIVAARKGYSPALRHLPRLQRTSIVSTHEIFYDTDSQDTSSGSIELIHHDTNTQGGRVHKVDDTNRVSPEVGFYASTSPVSGACRRLTGLGPCRGGVPWVLLGSGSGVAVALSAPAPLASVPCLLLVALRWVVVVAWTDHFTFILGR